MSTEIENTEIETPGVKGGEDPPGLEGVQGATETAPQRARNVA